MGGRHASARSIEAVAVRHAVQQKAASKRHHRMSHSGSNQIFVNC
jgi:hypothetical protein